MSNAPINVALFHPIQFSFYKAIQFPFMKIDNQIWLKQNMCIKLSIGQIFLQILTLSLPEPKKVSSKEECIPYCTFHIICQQLTLLLIGITLNYSPKLVNWKIFIPNLNWIKKISSYDNKKYTRGNIWHTKVILH